MNTKSFYDLDFIIEINENRIEQYLSAYQKVLERVAHLIFIYSGLTIFLFSIIQEIVVAKPPWYYIASFIVFISLFITSIVFSVKLIIPIKMAYLSQPKRYYEEYRLICEQKLKEKLPPFQEVSEFEEKLSRQVNTLLKSSYIEELERTLMNNEANFVRKNFYYLNALNFALCSAMPFLICLAIHLFYEWKPVDRTHLKENRITQINNQQNLCQTTKKEKKERKKTPILMMEYQRIYREWI